MFTQFYPHVQKTLPILLRGAGVFSAGMKIPQFITDVLNRSVASASFQKTPRAFIIPGISFFQKHLISTSRIPNNPQSDHQILSMLAAISLLAFSRKLNCTDEEKVDLDKLSSLIFKSLPALNELKNMTPVLFIGATDSGKSATMNYLMDIAMRVVKIDTLGQVILETDTLRGFKIRSGPVISETPVLKTLQDSVSGLMLTDCPGYRDDRSMTHKFVSEISSYLATQTAQKVKAIVVTISINDLTTRKADGLRDIVLTLHNFIKNGEEAKKSIFFLFTKSPITTSYFGRHYVQPAKKSEILALAKKIVGGINDKPENERTSNDWAARSIIELMVNGDDEGDGSKENPRRTGPEGPRVFVIDIFNKEQRKEILDAIGRAPGIERDQFNPNIKGNIELSLMNSFLKYLQIGFDIRHQDDLNKQEKHLHAQIKKSRANIQSIDSDLKSQLGGGHLNVEKHVDRIQKEITELEAKIEEVQNNIDHLNTEIARNDTKELVPYWEDTFLSEARIFDFFAREHIFEYKALPFVKEFLEDHGCKNQIIRYLISGGKFLEKRIDPKKHPSFADVHPSLAIVPFSPADVKDGIEFATNFFEYIVGGDKVGEYQVLKNEPEQGEYKSKYKVTCWGSTGDLKVIIKGPKNGRKDVSLLIRSDKKKLTSAKGELSGLEADKRKKEKNMNELVAISSQVGNSEQEKKENERKLMEFLKVRKMELERELVKDETRLQSLNKEVEKLECGISQNKENLINTVGLMQFGLLHHILKLDPNLVSILEESVKKISQSYSKDNTD